MKPRNYAAIKPVAKSTVTISAHEYADLLFCKHKLMFISEIHALQDTIKDLETMNGRLLDEKYKDVSLSDLLKGEPLNA